MKTLLLFLSLLIPVSLFGQAVSRAELKATNDLIRAQTVRNQNGWSSNQFSTNAQFLSKDTNTAFRSADGVIQMSIPYNANGVEFPQGATYGGNPFLTSADLSVTNALIALMPVTFTNIADMVANCTTNVCFVRDYWGTNYPGRGGGLFELVASNGFATNRGTVFKSTARPTKVLVRIGDPRRFNVQQFGATGDGATDDWPSIQNAINVLNGHGRIEFPGGTYLISKTITNYAFADVHFIGGTAGHNADPLAFSSVIYWAGDTNGPILDIDKGSQLIWEKVSFVNPSTNTINSVIRIDKAGAWSGNTTDIEFRDCIISSLQTNVNRRVELVQISPTASVNCEDIRFINCMWNGCYNVSITNRSFGITIGNNANAKKIVVSGGAALYCTNFLSMTNGSVLIDKMFTTGNGVDFNIYGSAEQCTIRDCRSEGNRNFLVYAGGSGGLILQGNTSADNTYWNTNQGVIVLTSGGHLVMGGNIMGAGHCEQPTFQVTGGGRPTVFSSGDTFSSANVNSNGVRQLGGYFDAAPATDTAIKWLGTLNSYDASGLEMVMFDFKTNSGSYLKIHPLNTAIAFGDVENVVGALYPNFNGPQFGYYSRTNLLGMVGGDTWLPIRWRADRGSAINDNVRDFWWQVYAHSNGMSGFRANNGATYIDIAAITNAPALRASHAIAVPNGFSNVLFASAGALQGGNLRDLNGNLYVTNSTGIDANSGGTGNTNSITNASPTTAANQLWKSVDRVTATNSGAFLDGMTNLTGVQTGTFTTVNALFANIGDATYTNVYTQNLIATNTFGINYIPAATGTTQQVDVITAQNNWFLTNAVTNIVFQFTNVWTMGVSNRTFEFFFEGATNNGPTYTASFNCPNPGGVVFKWGGNSPTNGNSDVTIRAGQTASAYLKFWRSNLVEAYCSTNH